MPEPREYYVILREPGSEEAWVGDGCRNPSWVRIERGPFEAGGPFEADRCSAHEIMVGMLRTHPNSRAIVARVRETTVEVPGETRWVVRDGQGWYLRRGDGWTRDQAYAKWHADGLRAAERLAIIRRAGYDARSIEPIEIGGTTRAKREILPEVE